MVRYTTPTLTLTVEDEELDLALAESVYVTLKQTGTAALTKTGDALEVEGNVVQCYLSEAETKSLRTGTALAQINWTYLDDDGTLRRASTEVAEIEIKRQLFEEEVTT